MPQADTLADTHSTVPSSKRRLTTRAMVALLLLCGLLLQVFFLRRYAFLAGDSLLYQDIALNWLHAHVYGLSTDAAPRPTLIRRNPRVDPRPSGWRVHAALADTSSA